MKIKALQEFTLIDYPGVIACTIFLHGCNFRCGFCHNPELVLSDVGKDYSEEEIFKFLEKRKGQLEGVCFTGGEPLMTIDPNFLKKIKDIGYLIKLDTNGSFPDLLEELIKNNLIDYVAMDIKASPENYKKIINADIDLNKIEKSIKIISKLNYYEFRTTILEQEHSLEEMEKIGKWVSNLIGKKAKKMGLQGFKNSGKCLDKSFENRKNTGSLYLSKLKDVLEDYFEVIEIRS